MIIVFFDFLETLFTMNGVVARLCRLPRSELVSNPSVVVLTELNTVAEKFNQVGPIPSAQLLMKISQPVSCMHPVHLKLFNRLAKTIETSGSETPPALSLRLFGVLSESQHPFCRRLLATVQSKWFDNWQPPSVERGSRRPKLKQNFVGPYADEAPVRYKIAHSGVIRNLDDDTLRDVVKHVVNMYERSPDNFLDVVLLSRELVTEYNRRFKGEGGIPDNFQSFIKQL
jgi:hypothetical protein